MNMPDKEPISTPKPKLRIIDAVVLIIGIVVGAGIFRTPSVVASNSPNEIWFLSIWALGGLISLVGALSYSELSSTFPNAGGDYHFLKLAFGKKTSFLFAWSRITITQTGSIALLAYIAGDYLTEILSLGNFSSTYYSAALVVILTLINILGIQFGTGVQKLLTSLQFAGILIVIVVGFILGTNSVIDTSSAFASNIEIVSESTLPVVNKSSSESILSTDSTISSKSTLLSLSTKGSISLALIFVLLTFGGWNEAAYISSEMRGGSKKMALVLIVSIVIITVIYVLINLSFLKVLGLSGIASSEAVGVDMMLHTLGERGVILIGTLVVLSALTSLNTTIFTGARSNYAFGKDFKPLSFMGKWDGGKSTPVNSLILQGAISIALIIFGAFTRNGFESMVDFTAPVFWFFLLLTGISLFVLRKKEPDVKRPFKVPFYPITPLIFVAFCAYMLYSSLTYTGVGSLVSVGVLFIGWFIAIIFDRRTAKPTL